MKTVYKWILGLGIGYVAYRIWKNKAGASNPINQGIENLVDQISSGFMGGVTGPLVSGFLGISKPDVVQTVQRLTMAPLGSLYGGTRPQISRPSYGIPTPIGGSGIFGGLLRNVRKRR
jgi:hypothetical protein